MSRPAYETSGRHAAELARAARAAQLADADRMRSEGDVLRWYAWGDIPRPTNGQRVRRRPAAE